LRHARFELGETLSSDPADGAARRSTRIALTQDAREIVEREPHVERALNQSHAVKRAGGIFPISIRRAARRREQSFPLVVPQRIGAHARLPRQLA
jgi:hypothetical protein